MVSPSSRPSPRPDSKPSKKRSDRHASGRSTERSVSRVQVPRADRWHRARPELWSDLGLDVDTIVDDGSGRGIGVGTARGKLRGKPASYGYVHVFTVRDGKVARFDEYVQVPEGGIAS